MEGRRAEELRSASAWFVAGNRGTLAAVKSFSVFGRFQGWTASLLWAACVVGAPIDVVDPNPALLTEAGQIITADSVDAVDRLAGSLPLRTGIVADGVSLLLLRTPASNDVTFTVSPRIGSLREVGGAGAAGTTLTVSPVAGSSGASWAFILYVAPDDLPAANVRRDVLVSARSVDGTETVVLKLENPPVLLVHGLWSSSETWDGLAEFLKMKGHVLCETVDCVVNYGPIQPAPSFDPFATEPANQFAIRHLIERTTNTLNAVRARGLAAAQVDVVAHSLGGLIARGRAAIFDGERAYRRPENFQRGDFHKLITVGTPHRGTPVADFIVSNRCARSAFFAGQTLEAYMDTLGFPIGPAVEEMRTVSAALTNLGATAMLPSHAIVGIAPRQSATETVLDSLPGAIGFFVNLDSMLGGNGNHDTIVPRSSQMGGLPRKAVTFARGIVHTDVAPFDVPETESALIWRRIAQLLRVPTTSRLFGNFTALETNTVPATPPCE